MRFKLTRQQRPRIRPFSFLLSGDSYLTMLLHDKGARNEHGSTKRESIVVEMGDEGAGSDEGDGNHGKKGGREEKKERKEDKTNESRTPKERMERWWGQLRARLE